MFEIAEKLFKLLDEVEENVDVCTCDTVPNKILLSGGDRACSGIAPGKVHKINEEHDIENTPEGAVLVARNASPHYVKVMDRLSAVVTDMGSTAGHFASVAREFGVPVYFHTGTPIYALPLQLAALARDFPDVSFIMGHSGFADFWYDALPAAQDAPNIILEASFAMPSMLAQAVEVLGPERLVFGSDAPMSDPVLELLKLRQLALPGEELILGDNMARLLRLKERKR